MFPHTPEIEWFPPTLVHNFGSFSNFAIPSTTVHTAGHLWNTTRRRTLKFHVWNKPLSIVSVLYSYRRGVSLALNMAYLIEFLVFLPFYTFELYIRTLFVLTMSSVILSAMYHQSKVLLITLKRRFVSTIMWFRIVSGLQ